MEKVKQKLINWAQKDYYEPIYFSGTDLIDDLICFLNGGSKKKDFILSDGFCSGGNANLLILSGFINHKNCELLKLKYKNLKGKKFVLSAGFMVNNQLDFPEYNRANLPEDFISIDEHVYGPTPTREDIVRAILRLDR